MTTTITINDIDGQSTHTTFHGRVDDALAAYPQGHPVHDLILDAWDNGDAESSYLLDGDEYRTRVVASAE